MANGNDMLRFLTCGSVDDGKSTLIGHLLKLTGNLYDDQLRTLETESARPGVALGTLDYALLLDGLMAEREQGITIDVAYRYFETPMRKFVVADTPGHERYTRNMATGASQCAAAVILVDACRGVLPQTRRHALICSLLGVGSLMFAVNKMDRLDWLQEPYDRVRKQCSQLVRDLEAFGAGPLSSSVIPVSALTGDNLTVASRHMSWYPGPTLLGWLEGVQPREESSTELRFPVQYVIKGGAQERFQPGAWQAISGEGRGLYRAYAGSIVSGRVKVGELITVLPRGIQAAVAELRSGGRPVPEAQAGMAVSLTLEGEFDVSRGDLITRARDRVELSDLVKAQVVWMSEQPLYAGRQYLYQALCGSASAEATRIRARIELDSYQRLAADRLDLNDVGEVELTLSRPVPFDPYRRNWETGSFILIDRISNATVACGMIMHSMRRASNVQWQLQEVRRAERAELKGQKPCVIWFTGLSGSGKSALANVLERRLHGMGRHCMLLDGDNIRKGLNRDLGFTEADRVENIRRVGEVAKILTDAGLIVITAFISPFAAEREMARRLLPEGEFIEVYLATPLEECERRDPKGLYAKARRGEIPNFTGISSPYQAPQAPEVRLDTAREDLQACVGRILSFLTERGLLQEAS